MTRSGGVAGSQMMRCKVLSIREYREQEFGSFSELVHMQAQNHPSRAAMIQDDRRLNYAELDELMDRIAASLQRDGIKAGEAVAICASTSIEYGAAFLGIVRAGAAAAPLAPSSTPETLVAMLKDCSAKILFVDAAVAKELERLKHEIAATWIALDASPAGQAFYEWLLPKGARPTPVTVTSEQPFNIIYSSGTTGTPKGIVQPHRQRWTSFHRDPGHDYTLETDATVLISTGLYSNTTLVSFLPAFAGGNTVVLMAKFDVERFLTLAQKHRVTHAMLVPVQYQRIMSHPDFDKYDLSSFRMKYCTSAPFAAALKADVLKRWPGGLTEYYGMTEGGGGFVLYAHETPHKLHTVGKPWPDHEIRFIDEQGNEVPNGQVGEIVGRSLSMMLGYHNQPGKTRDAEWYDKLGNRYIRTGDVGRLDEDGFLILMDRRKDMIISGGFNIYPSDLEAAIHQHDAVAECAVVGVPSEQWGETPVAFVVLKQGRTETAEQIRAWVNQRLGKTQRISAIEILRSLPRSHIGKVLKRELRDSYRDRQRVAVG